MNVKKIVAVLASAAMCSGMIAPAISAEEVKYGGFVLDVNGNSAVVKSCDADVTALPSPEQLLAVGVAITGIGDYAFSGKDKAGCDKIESVDIPDTVTTIGKYAFYNCDGIKTITIGAGVASIGEFAFAGCTALTEIKVAEGNANYKSINGALYSADGSKLLWVPEALTDFVIAKGTKEIASYAFSSSDITDLSIPYGVTSIGQFSFFDSELKTVKIPSTVKTIGVKAFEASVVISGVKNSAANAYANKNGNQFVAISEFTYDVVDGKAYITGCSEDFDGVVEIPAIIDGYDVVGITSLVGKNSITELVIPASVVSIDFSGLASLSALEKVTIDAANTVYKSIDGAIYSADGSTLYFVPATVKTFKVADGAVKIADYAIAYGACTSITVPASVTDIGTAAFCYGPAVTVYGYTDYVRDYALNNKNTYVSLAEVGTLGDVNGDGVINSSDAYAILVYCAGSDVVDTTGVTLATADTNKDGNITAFDALLVLQYDAEIISEF